MFLVRRPYLCGALIFAAPFTLGTLISGVASLLIVSYLYVNAGGLLVTSATGRGVPVLDFIALNEKMETMETILDFFKTHNNSWRNIETFVIDKACLKIVPSYY